MEHLAVSLALALLLGAFAQAMRKFTHHIASVTARTLKIKASRRGVVFAA
jgi:hypothetical protein